MSTAFKGLTVQIGADTKQFNKEMRQVDRSIKETNKQVNELEKALELEFDSGKFAEAQRLAQEAIQGTEAKAQALRDQLKYMEEAGTDKTSENYRKLQTELLKTENQAVLLKKRLDEINNIKVEAMAKKFKDAGDAIGKAGKALAPFSAAAAAALAGLGAIGKSAISSAAEIDDLSQMVNMNAEALQKWRYIAMQLGLDNTTLQTALTKTQAAFADLTQGEVSPAADALTMLGFSAEQAAKGMDANFEEMVKRLAQVSDATTQAYLANELFGDRLGSKVIPLLNGGAEGLAALTAEFEALGYMTNEQVAELASFDDELNRIKKAFIEIKNQIGVALLPVMQTLADFVSNKIVPAFKALSEWFGNLSDRQKNLITGALAAVAALAPMLLILGKLTSGTGSLIKGIQMLGKALSVLAAHPIILIIAAIAALMLYLYNTNEQFKESIDSLVSVLGEALAPILNAIGEIFKTLFTELAPLIEILAQVLVPVINLLAQVLKPVGDLIAKVINKHLQTTIKIIQTVVGVIIKIAQVISDILIPVFDWLSKAFDNFISFIPKAIESVLKFIERMVNDVLDFINKIIRNINKMGDVLGFTIKELDNVTINTNFAKQNDSSTQSKGVASSPVTVSDVISSTPSANTPGYVTNNDYSNKDITINVTVENYAEEVDVDDMVRQINLKLAAQM